MHRVAMGLAVVAAGATIAWGLSIHPAVPLVVALGVVGVGLSVASPTRSSQVFLGGLALLLGGYALFGRGFAHWGTPPVFVGEVILVLGLVLLVPNGTIARAWRSPILWAWGLFALWGALRSVVFFDRYGVDVLRDSVLWGYGIFAVLVAGALVHTQSAVKVPAIYRRLLPWLLVIPPIVFALTRILSVIPYLPGSDVPLVEQKAGDVCVHLAGVGIFLLLGLDRPSPRAKSPGTDPARHVLWILWMGVFLMAGIANRGGMLAVVVAMTLALLFARSFTSLLTLYRPVLAGVVVLSVVVIADIRIDMGRRSLSTEQLLANVESIVGTGKNKSLSGTREWRLSWWRDIVEYTVFGPYFWTGRGYGVNLETTDGYITSLTGEGNRSPHNGHMTVLARSGVPGFVLWLGFLAVFSATLLRAYYRLQRAGRDYEAASLIWIWAYWVAFLVNGTFDTYLEGPQGGIWFWSLTGIGAALVMQYDGLGRAGAAVVAVPRSSIS